MCFCTTFDFIFETRPISLVNSCLLRLTLPFRGIYIVIKLLPPETAVGIKDGYNLPYIYLSDFVKTWPLGFRLAPGVARLQASPVRKNVGGLTSCSVQLDSPGAALTVGGWIRPWGQN